MSMSSFLPAVQVPPEPGAPGEIPGPRRSPLRPGRPPEPDGLARAGELDKKIVARALDLGGSCSGEHGVGIGKREFLEREHGLDALAVMYSVKQALDPRGIMNPGKIFLN